MKHRATGLLSASIAALALVSACGGDDELHVADISKDQAWHTVNTNLHSVLPDWPTNTPFPEDDPTGPLNGLKGCKSEPPSYMASGPPWSVRVEATLSTPTASEKDEINRGLDTLLTQGFTEMPGNDTTEPDERAVTNTDKYVVSVNISSNTGSPEYSVSSSSPCIRFPGDDKYQIGR
ncbi:hypothetical protein [Gordonia soli]|uniref:Lipoprotein n=1 Tax=Gordonia soli NBRC 108243 TaxID=1223545 RepID=M0QJY8_9ACTN|nr:hypothetical protein [Gordonia soli]GAC68606.1 hypothetical protein GS4_16_01370 [Gordonia soli NBRC 108243]